MHEASDLFKKAISQQHRELRIRTNIEGKEYSGTDVQSCSIEESILTGEDFKFGSSTASAFDLTLLNMDESLSAKSFEKKEVHIEIGVVLDKFSKPVEYVSMGSFIIEEASKEKSTIRLSGFDRMILFEKPYVTKLTYPATLKQILIEICMLAGVSLETTSFLNDDYVVRNKPDLEGINLRMGLEYVSELACSFARINRKSKLELVTLVETPLTIDKSNYYDMKLSEYEYGPLDYVVINNEGIIEDIGEGTNILEIKDNIFTFNPNEQLLQNIYDRVKNFKFKPFSTTWQGNPLTSPGDLINVAYKNGETYKSFIAKQKFSFENGLKCDIETNAKTQMQLDFETKGSVTSDLGRVKASIKNLGNEIRLEVDDLNESIGAINVKADNIKFSVTDLSGRLGNAEASISLQANQIQTKVSQSDFTGQTITSKLTQDPYSIALLAQNLSLQGLVTFTNLSTPGQTVIDGGNIYGNLFRVGNASGGTALDIYALAGSHRISSYDAAGFRIESQANLSLKAGNGLTIYALSKLWAQANFQVTGSTQLQDVISTGRITANNFYKDNGQMLVDALYLANMNYVSLSTLNQRIAQLETDIKVWANGKFVIK